VAALARRAAAGGGVAVWSFDPKRWSHWLLLVFIAGFLVSYFGFVSWGRLGDALEALAERPAGAQIFHEKIDRADAIFMIFVFLFLTPLALVAGFSIVTFVGSVLTGMLEAIYRRPGMPEWVSTLCVYLLLALAAYLTRVFWYPQVQGFASLIARAMIMAVR